MSQSRHEIRAEQLRESRRGNGGNGRSVGNGNGGYGGGSGGGRGGYDPRGPRGGQERPRWKRWAIGTLKWGSLAGLVLLVIGVIGVWVAYSKTTIPEPNDIAGRQVSVIYYADGKQELDRMVPDEGNRESVELKAIPKVVQDAHIAAEDRSFYVNNGIDLMGILRAVKTGLTGDAQVGGSTITQQYVKNFYLSQDRTFDRKAKEILISVKIDGELTKEEILEKYLNTIYYGRGAYGIKSGAKAYFGVTDLSKLTVAQAAVLASVINAPSYYDPAEGKAAAANLERRFNYVLDGMVEEGWLPAAERAKITALPEIKPKASNPFGGGPTGYITAAVRKELIAKGLTEAELERGGLRIVTTIDYKAQANAVKAMTENIPKGGVTGGLVAMTPGDGAVVAMYGGADYRKSQLSTATQAILQAGSNFKPFAVLAAVRDGISTKTQFDGNSPKTFGATDGGKVTINNFGKRDYGKVDMRRMIGRSINTAFVELNEKIGPKQTRLAAIDAGIPEKTPGLDDTLTNVLGTSSPRVVDMATAYSTIASQGVRATPYFIKGVTSTLDGGFTYEAAPKTQRAFDKNVTADVTDAMTYTVKPGGTATKLQDLKRPVAGKTGTSEENKSIWFSGFVPQLAVSIGLYKPDADGNPTTMTDDEGYNLTGGTIPADIFMAFMEPTLKGVEVVPFPKRVGVGDDEIKTPTTTVPPRTPPPPATTTEAPTPTPTVTESTKEPGKPTKTVEPTPTDTATAPLPSLPGPTTSTKPGNNG